MQTAGYRVKVGAEVTSPRPWGQEADAARARALEEAWQDKEITAVLSARGGYGSLKILPYLEVEALRPRPLRLVGFSDLTALLLFVVQRLGMTAFHGPTVAHLPALSPAAREDFPLAGRPRPGSPPL